MISRLRKFAVSLWPLVLTGLIFSNFVLSYSAFRSASPREYHFYREITNTVFSTSSDVPSSVVSTNIPVPVASSSPLEPQKPQEFLVPYNFMVISGAPCMRYYGRYYYEGDVMSRGRIFRIFPDRVFLATGDVLVNSRSASDTPSSALPSRSPLPKSPPFKRMFK